jgi:predicted GIY-YIG superfamily endonuclease
LEVGRSKGGDEGVGRLRLWCSLGSNNDAFRREQVFCFFYINEMEPISVMPCVYVLRLEGDDKFDDYYYVGSTHQLNIRIAQHIALCGAKFTKLHKFVSIYSVELVNGDALQRENELTLELMNTFSSDCVRGGKYCRL